MSISSTIKEKCICHILIWMRFYYDPSKGVTTANGKSHKPYETLQQFRFSLFVGTLLPRDPVSYSIMVCQLSGEWLFSNPQKNKETIRVILINIVKSNVALVSLSCCNVTKKSFHVKLGGMLTWFAEGFFFYYICCGGIKDKLVDHTNG